MPFATAAGRHGRRIAAAALLTASALSLSACHGDSGTATAPAIPFPAYGNSAPHTGTPVACTPEMLTFRAGPAGHGKRPDGPLLLTVTNYADKTCTFAAQPYPLLRLTERQRAAVPVITASRPRNPVSLAPHQSAYATIRTTTGHAFGHHHPRISQFGVALATGAAPAQVGLDSSGPVRVEPDTARVTYWQAHRADALRW
ncbi:DUF4232 domain-containing protein [Streptomyces pinistramenti]|uniref:DUF4232 domain-containing protein n=1 Tax=Streptomyces pinistramenti TaxID=2884812 RepID=UPI001D072287|nr:DUF4232 domain-containing protein [Streptomyces pinistramenti]MCB5912178.1 DUF4232 domain-containing protein [Streptomyces pinistramenti]